MSGYKVSSSVVTDLQELEAEWSSLQARAACSYFQSWGWISVWLKQIATDIEPRIVRVWYGGNLVGLGIFVHRDIRRHLFISSNALFLNEYPFDGLDMSIEYNGLLADPDHREAVYAEVICHLFGGDSNIDEVFFGAIAAGTVSFQGLVQSCARQDQLEQQLLEASPARAVDLVSIGPGMDGYLGSLSRNRRAQIQRSMKLYEASGALQLEEAGNTEMALEFLSGLAELHTRHWQSRGQQGSFANRRWEAFHRALIAARFGHGEIQVIRVGNAEGPIGYLYNFIWRKRVYVLQTGFSKSPDKRFMPGYVVHALAVAHNKQKGMEIYDLMHGDALYKRILCNRSDSLEWVVVQRRRWKFGLENRVLKTVRCVKAAGRLAAGFFKAPE